MKLCYVSGPWAYFTSAPLDKQWGDDWNDAPYEHNAETPYPWLSTKNADGSWTREEVTITKVAWEGPFCTPAEMSDFHGSSYSVQAINGGAVAWLTPRTWTENSRAIPAGMSLEEFTERVKEAGGKVYLST